MSEKVTSILQQLPAEGDELSTAIKYAINRAMLDLDKCMPALLLDYDREKNTATVQPLVNITLTDGTNRERPKFKNIPVLSYGGGGFNINYPLQPNTLGWIFGCDRDIELVMQEQKPSPAPTAQKHSFSSAFFVPDVWRNYTINGEDSEAMVIQAVDGAVRISLTSSEVRITASSKVKVDAPEIINTANTITNNGNTIVNGELTVNGGSQLNGTANISGNSTLSGGATIGGIDFGSHVHSDPQGGNTGGPQ